MKHKHKFNETVAMDAPAYYQKPNWPKSKATIVRGNVFRCECDTMIMEPHDMNLYPTFVEFELVKK